MLGMSLGYSARTLPVGLAIIQDVFAGAYFGVSVRKISADYSGPCLRVRRSLDNAEQDIGFDAEGSLDSSDLSSFVPVGDAFVTRWYDQFGGHTLSQDVATRQPKIVESGSVLTRNGKPAPTFSLAGPDVQLGVDFPAAHPQPVSFHSAYYGEGFAPDSGLAMVTDGRSSGNRQAFYYADHQPALFAGDVERTTPLPDAGGHVAAYVFLDTASSPLQSGLWIDRSLIADSSMRTGDDPLSGLIVGNRLNDDAAFPGAIQEVVMFLSDESPARGPREEDQADYFGVTLP